MVHKLERASSSSFIVGLSAYMINLLFSPIKRKLIGLKYQPPVTCRVPLPRRAQEKLKVFCAKRKFRAAVHTLIACQQLEGRLSKSAGMGSTPVSPGGDKGNIWSNGPATTRTTFGGRQSPKSFGPARNTFGGPQPLRGRSTMKRKGTGMFNVKGWRESVITARNTTVQSRQTELQRQSSLVEVSLSGWDDLFMRVFSPK